MEQKDSEQKTLNRRLMGEDIHCEFLCPDGIMAQIPWLPRREPTVAFEQSEFRKFFEVHETPGEKSSLTSINEALTEAFPFYLPARYHSMDAEEMHRRASSPGSYWTNAIHYFRTCSDYGTMPFYHMTPEPWWCLKSVAIKGTECKFQDFKKIGPDQCETAAEFLLEPWVIIQLPFQPVLLHQWAVAAYAESLKFNRRLVEISTRGYARKFRGVFKDLHAISLSLYKNSHALLDKFLKIFCVKPEESPGAKLKKLSDGYEDMMTETLAALEFVLSDDCTFVLHFIKSKSWSRERSPADLEAPSELTREILNNVAIKVVDEEGAQVRMSDGDNDNMYTKMHMVIERVCNSVVTLCKPIDEMRPEDFLKIDKDAASFQKELNESEELLSELKSFILSEILKDGPLKGLKSTEDFINNISENLGKDSSIMKYKLRLMEALDGLDDRAPEVEKGGFLVQILHLESCVRAEEILGSMTRMVWLAAKRFDAGVYLELDKAPLPGVSIQELKNKLDLKSRKEHWSYEVIFENLYRSGQIWGEWGDYFKGLTADRDITCLKTTANLLMKRIRTIVATGYQIKYLQIDSRNKANEFHPERQFQQYILPCFVAMILDVEKSSEVPIESKIAYARLVNKLMEKYTYQPPLQDFCWDDLRKRYFSGRVNIEQDIRKNLDAFGNTLMKLFEGSTDVQNIVSKFRSIDMCFGKPLPIDHPALSKRVTDHIDVFTPIDSKVQLFKFCLTHFGESPNTGFSVDDLLKTFNILIDNETSDIEKLTRHYRVSMGKNAQVARTSPSQAKSKRESFELTVPQILGIAIFLAWKYKMSKEKFLSTFQSPRILLDPLGFVVEYLVWGDWWKLKSRLAAFTKSPEACEDLSIIPFDVAIHNILCRPILKSLNASRKRVKMDQPGQVTFNPILHCRWCGLVNSTDFRLCVECKDEPDYPHPNYFCSEKCEKEAWEKLHSEEHAQFIMEILKIV